MTTKPKTRKAQAAIDPVFAAISEHKALIREYIRYRNNSHAARAQAEKKHGKSLEGAALIIAAAEDTRLEYDKFNRAANAARKAAKRTARTKPTTIAGVAALIGHIRHEINVVSDREIWEDWVPTAVKTAASSLTRMGREAA
jgi:hypothetical protein